MLSGWEGKRGTDVALAMHHTVVAYTPTGSGERSTGPTSLSE